MISVLSRDNHTVATIPAPKHHHHSPYGYTPTEWIAILFIALFGLSTSIHVFQALYKPPRLYWILPTIVLCGICELLGWSARLWSSQDVLNINPFLMQITTTIIAPTFFTAGIYTILGKIISILGPQFSRLTPKAYLIVFVTADVVALVIQAIGGAKASLAFQHDHDPNPGAHIMLAGIFFQMAGIVLYLVLATEFLLRVHFQKPVRYSPIPNRELSDFEERAQKIFYSQKAILPSNVGPAAVGMVLASLFVLIRSIYRTVELLGGWTGKIITTEKFFNILDGTPMVLAMYTMNILHPRSIW